MKKRLALILPLMLAACAGTSEISRDQPPGFVRNAREVVEQADWSNPRVVEIDMVNHAFRPDEITVRRGEPVRLIFRNPSSSDHTFVAKEFFRGVAVRQLVTPQGVQTGNWVEKIAVAEGTTQELWFVPTRFGAFQAECTVPGHALLGMKAVVNVVE